MKYKMRFTVVYIDAAYKFRDLSSIGIGIYYSIKFYGSHKIITPTYTPA